MESLESLARFAFAVLVTGLWQAALLAGVAWLVLRSVRSMNATTRHAVLASALLASLLLPVVTVALTFEATGTQPAVTSTRIARRTVEPGRIASVATATAEKAAKPLTQTQSQTPSGGLPAFERARFVLPRLLVLALVGIWLIGALVVLARLIVSLVHLERLKRDALPLPVEYRQRLDRWTGAAKGSRDVRLCRSSEIVIPIAVGLFDAMILVPEQLVEELAPQDVDRILLHELAHLRRADDWFNAIERIAQALLFFNPGVQWIVRQLDLEREVACDDWVLAQTNEPLPYASCLAKVAEVTMWPYQAMAAPGAFVTRKSMSIRIERLLAVHRDVRIRLSYGPVGSAALALLALCIGAAYVAPSIAYPLAAAIAPLPATAPHRAATPLKTGAAKVAPAQTSRKAAPAKIESPSVIPAGVAVHVATHVGTHVAHSVLTHVDAHMANSPIVADTVARTGYIDELASVGLTGLTLDELVELKSLGVTAAYVRSLASVGYTHPTVREIAEAKSLGITADYVRELRDYFGAVSLAHIGEYRALGITGDYAKSLAAAGYPHLTPNQMEEARSLGVTADYIVGLRQYFGSTALMTMNDITEYKALGLTPDYAHAMAAAGYADLSMRDMEDLKALGIDPEFIRRAAAHGFRNLTVKQLENLKASGIL
jgi:beta-lactamase regulating signal transducer with metallopeptidase domain